MLGTAWCGQMGISGWLTMLALWGSFIALVAWAITRMFPAPQPADPTGVRALAERSASDRATAESSGWSPPAAAGEDLTPQPTRAPLRTR